MTVYTGQNYQTLTVTTGDYRVNFTTGASPVLSIVNNTDGTLVLSGAASFTPNITVKSGCAVNNWYPGSDTLFLRAEADGTVPIIRG